MGPTNQGNNLFKDNKQNKTKQKPTASPMAEDHINVNGDILSYVQLDETTHTGGKVQASNIHGGQAERQWIPGAVGLWNIDVWPPILLQEIED